MDFYDENKSWLKDMFEGFKDSALKIFKKTNKNSISMSNLYERVWSAISSEYDWMWLIDLYVDSSTQQIFAIFAKEGMLYKSELEIENDSISIGQLVRVAEEFEPVPSTLLMKRQNDGIVRWFMISSSSVLNRSASIDSSELFDNLIRRSKETSKYPYLTYYHLGELLKMGITDWLARDGNLLLASGIFESGNAIAEAMQKAYSNNPEYWGASIAFWPLQGHMEEVLEGISVPMYTDGIFEEISILAEKDANCLFTALHSKGKVNRMKDELKAQIKLLAGEDEELAEQIISQVDQKNSMIEENNLIRRQADSSSESDESEETTEETEQEELQEVEEQQSSSESLIVSQETPEIEIDETIVSTIVEQMVLHPSIVESLAKIEDLSTSLTALQNSLTSELEELRASKMKENGLIVERLKKLEIEEEQKKEEWVNDLPKSSKTVIRYRPRVQSDEVESVGTFEDVAQETLRSIK